MLPNGVAKMSKSIGLSESLFWPETCGEFSQFLNSLDENIVREPPVACNIELVILHAGISSYSLLEDRREGIDQGDMVETN